MNATVARIVEILFQDTVMSEEVVAFKDEVMNNCQERYDDLRSCGMGEDEAIDAVVDSLKGMEKVIAQYPQKEIEKSEDDEEGDDEDNTDLVFDPDVIRQVKTLTTSENINYEYSTDGMLHVYYSKKQMPYLVVEADGDTLQIRRDNDLAGQFEKAFKNDHGSVEINSFAEFMQGMRKVLNRMQGNFSFQSRNVTISLPQSHVMELGSVSTSGDISIDGVNANHLTLTTTSGNVEISLEDDVQAERIQVNTTSGDMTIHAHARAAELRAVSGDVEYEGDCPELLVSTVSGDSTISATMTHVKMTSVSGDMELDVQDTSLRLVEANTTSGDLSIHLPHELRGRVDVKMKSVSGDCHNCYGSCDDAPLATVHMKSVSGDLSLD